jgi:tripartite-type tricarboxylate transporter receptor subunit TctC
MGMNRAMRVVLAAGLAVCASAVCAQDYPNRLVTIIVPYPAGGPTDQIARELATQFSAKLKQNFVVENVSGGGTTIATGRVARAAPDGYTLLLHNLQISANVALYPKLGFDTEKDLTPVGFINHNPLVLTGRKSLAPNRLGELIALMKREPLKMAHPGAGSTGHLATSLFAKEAKVEVIQVPYRGAAPALQDIASRHHSRWCNRSRPGKSRLTGLRQSRNPRCFPTSRASSKNSDPSLRFCTGTRCSCRPERHRR